MLGEFIAIYHRIHHLLRLEYIILCYDYTHTLIYCVVSIVMSLLLAFFCVVFCAYYLTNKRVNQ